MTKYICIDDILPNPEQPRKEFDAAGLQALAETIKENGIIQAITVERAGGNYILHDGERRVRAARLAGVRMVPAFIVDGGGGDRKIDWTIRAMVANLQREDLNPIDEGRAYLRMKSLGLTAQEIALKVGVYRDRIDSRLVLLELDEPIQRAIAAGEFSRSDEVARALLKIEDVAARIGLVERLRGKTVSNRAIIAACEKLAQALGAEKKEKRSGALNVVRERPDENDWNALFQIGRVPPWSVVNDTVYDTCDACALSDTAGELICGGCPLVDALRRMLRAVEKGG